MLIREMLTPAFMFVFAVHILTGLSVPQETETDSYSGPTFKSEVVHVPVDAVVRGRNGAFINNLKAQDFAVYDNGVEQSIVLLSQKDVPLDIALIVDNSVSIKPYVMQLHQSAMMVLQKLSDKDRIALFALGTFPVQLSGLTSDLSMVKRVIGIIPRMSVTNISRTNIRDALCHASRYLKAHSQNHRRVIILVSDNEELSNWVEHGEEEVASELLESNVVLYSIKTEGTNFGYGNTKLIEQYVSETGGETVRAKSEEHLSEALNSVIESVKSSYILGFNPSDVSDEQRYHKITVKIKTGARCAGCRVQARKGYYIGGQGIPSLKDKMDFPQKGQSIVPELRSSDTGDFPINFFSPNSISYDVLAPMIYNFWSSGMSGNGITPFERYVNAFKDAFRDDLRIQLMLTRFFMPEYKRMRSKIKPDDMNAYAKSLQFYTGKAYKQEQAYKSSIIPSELTPQEGLRYRLKVKDSEDSSAVRLDVNVGADPIFFYYTEEQHKCLLLFFIEYQDRPETASRFMELSFPEEKFRRILKSGMPISVKIPVSATDTAIRLTILDPFSYTFGVQSIPLARHAGGELQSRGTMVP